MKLFIAGIVMFGCLSIAKAAPLPPMSSGQQSVKIVVPLYSTSTVITLGTSVATEITSNSITPTLFSGSLINLFYDVTVWNTDTTNDVFCAPSNSAVAASGANLGIKITHGSASTQPNSLHFLINPYQQIFCIGGAGTPVITVLKQQ